MPATTAPASKPDLSGFVKKSEMPGAGSTAPPPVNATGAAGNAEEYARADHTHVSSILKVVKATDANGVVSWDFPDVNGKAAFAAPPVIQVTVETASGQPYLPLITSKTAANVTIKVLRAQALPSNLVAALVGGIFNVFGGAVPAGVPVHIYAAKATQS